MKKIIILISFLLAGCSEHKRVEKIEKIVEFRPLEYSVMNSYANEIYYGDVEFWIKRMVESTDSKTEYYQNKIIQIILQRKNELKNKYGPENAEAIIKMVEAKIRQ